LKRSKTQLKTTSKKIENKVDKVISTFKGILFKNKDIISGRELVGGGIVSEETESRLLNLKKLRKLNNIYYIWDYNEEFKKLIFSYKYNRKKSLAKLIAGLISEEFEYIIQKEKIDFIVSVPINKKRESERGYNQVDEILKQLNVNYVEIKRVKNTKKMHKLLNEKLREENIRGSFRIGSDFDFKNKKILLVDDIITTGATLREIKNSILDDIDRKVFINSRNRKIAEAGSERTKNRKTEITVFCLAAAREIKMNKGEV
jgi:amidophosphoribosyltransferase-like protein